MGIIEIIAPARRPRISLLRWTLPVVLGLLAVLYEIGPGRQIYDDYGVSVYFDLDIVFYGSVRPAAYLRYPGAAEPLVGT